MPLISVDIPFSDKLSTFKFHKLHSFPSSGGSALICGLLKIRSHVIHIIQNFHIIQNGQIINYKYITQTKND